MTDLFTAEQRAKLLQNSIDQGIEDTDKMPVVKLFTPDAHCTWLLSELDQDGRLFGLCDLGMGEPELGYVLESELTDARGGLGLKVERDLHFVPKKMLSEYAKEAHAEGRIVA